MFLAPPECLHMRRETHKRHSIYYSNGRGQTSQHKYSLACHSSLRPSTICVHFVTPLLLLLLYHYGNVRGGFYCVRSLVMADTLFACSCSILLPDWPFKYVSNVCFSGTSAFNNIEIYLHGLKYFVLVGHNIRLENGCCTWNSPTSIWGRQVMRWLRFVIIILYLKLKDYSVWRGGGS